MSRYVAVNKTGRGVNLYASAGFTTPLAVRLPIDGVALGDTITNGFLKCTVKGVSGWLPVAGMLVTDNLPIDPPPPPPPPGGDPPPLPVAGHVIKISGEIAKVEIDGNVVWTA